MHTEDYGWTSDRPPQSSSYINGAVVRRLHQIGARTVLDVGCGNGVLCGELARDGFEVLGFDADREAIEYARASFPDVNFAVANFSSEPSEQFDAVVSTEVIEHLYDPESLATFAHKSLKTGGSLVITTPYHGYLKNLAISLTGKWDVHHGPN